MKAKLTYQESRITKTAVSGPFTVGHVCRVERQGRAFAEKHINAWCSECDRDVDSNGNAVHSARFSFVSDQAGADALALHAVKCDAMINEMTRHVRSVAA